MLKSFFWEGILFTISSLIGIFTAYRIKTILEEIPLGIVYPEFFLLHFLLSFLIITLFIFYLTILKRFKKTKKGFYKLLFILSVFWGGAYILNMWFGAVGIFLIAVLIILWLRLSTILFHNLVMVLGIAGAGSFLGIGLYPEMVIIILGIFSLYDYIAVYKTKHMIEMAKSMLEAKAIVGFIIPSKLSDFWEKLEEVKPGGKFYILGGGDIVFPIILSVSVLQQGILKSLFVFIFSLGGLFLAFWLFNSQKEKNPIPALPPIAFISILGYLITLIF